MSGLIRLSGFWLVAAALIALAPVFFPSGFALSIMGQMGVAVIFALAYNMLLGQGGMLSFGHAVYFGVAGYFTIHYLNLLGDEVLFYFPISLMPLFGGLVGLVFGILVGYVSTRRAGTTFAMISLGFGEMATALTLIFVSFFNGEEGIQGDRMVGPEPFGITYGPDIQVFYLIGVWGLVAAAGMYALTKTPFGRMSNAVRDNPERAQFIGYNPQRVRWQAFSLSAFFSGIAGALHALNFEHVGFETVGAEQSGYVLFMVFIGGVGHFLGPLLGAIVITFLRGTLGEVTEAWPLYLGAFFIMMVVYAPGGLAGLVMLHEPLWKVHPKLLRRLVVPYLAGLASALVAAAGVVGLVEVLYFLSHEVTGETHTTLVGIDLDLHTPGPWVTLVGLALLGYFLCKKTFPMMVRGRAEAMEEAKKGAPA